MTRIIVTERASDYHACIDGDPKLWGCGDTIAEAIGSCIMNHKECTDIEIIHTNEIKDMFYWKKQAWLRRHLTAWEYDNKKRIEMNEQKNAGAQKTI